MSIYSGKDPMWVAKRGTVTNGLVGHWDSMAMSAADRFGTRWLDLSGNNNHGSLVGGAAFDRIGCNFDGNDDRINLPSRAIAYGSSNFSIMSFVRLTTTSLLTRPIYSEEITGGTVFILRINNDATISGGVNTSNGVWTFVTTNQAISTNTWIHVSFIGSSGQLTLFINGVSSQSTSWNNLMDRSIANSYIGGSSNSGYWNGGIEDIRIYNRALSAAEILRNFNATRARFGV